MSEETIDQVRERASYWESECYNNDRKIQRLESQLKILMGFKTLMEIKHKTKNPDLFNALDENLKELNNE